MANTLIHDLQHHAQDKAEVASAIALAFASMLNPNGWQVWQNRTANNSWSIYLMEEGKTIREWYFTGYKRGTVTARNAYFMKDATRVVELKTRRDVIRWAKTA